MPKVSVERTDSPIKKAPRKRAVRRVVRTVDTSVRRTRATVPAQEPSFRKAPARVLTPEAKKPIAKRLYINLFIIVLVLGTATWIGFSDNGAIDVNARITERNQKYANDVNAAANEKNGENIPETIVVPVQNSAPTIPNAGLRGRGVGTPDIVTEVPPAVEATSTTTQEATTTEPESTEDTEVELAP